MSAEPPNPSGLPGRNRPHLSDLSRETTEEDLWNLDEETTAAVRPRQPKAAPAAPAAKDVTPVPEPAGPAEPPMPRGLSSPVKPLTPRSAPSDEIGELDEDEIPATPKAKSKPATPPAPANEVVALTSAIDEAHTPPAAAAPSAPTSPAVADPEPSVDEEEEEEEQEEADGYEDDLLAKTTSRENRPRGASSPAAKGNIPRPRLNRREVIGIATFVVVAMIASVWVLTRFFSLLSFTRDSDSRPSYPMKGQLATISSGSTFWREPVRSGESRDVAKRDVVLIPVLELSLDPGNSGGGSLRVIFRNAEGNPVGDPITRGFGAGRFETTGNATATFTATDGFSADGDFQAYRTGKGKLWTVDVLEGPPGGTPASSFKKLSSIPILPERR
ncbi:hypothetical protein [Luteolibacter soli]|uniref:Uncharacterized protein n=1 Tax=Luteolibacter soli TaxID=3135280 RepID=A0ABU9AWX9_9BACT